MPNEPRPNLLLVLLMQAINVTGDFFGIWLCGNGYGVALASFPTIGAGFGFGN